MELKSITVKGYRNVSNVKLDFGDLTSVLSLNNYGKSNLLTAIVFGVSFMQRHPKEKQLMMNDVTRVPMLKNNDNSKFEFELECESIIDNIKYEISYLYSFNWANYNEKKNGKIISELLKIKGSQDIGGTYIKRENKNATYRPSLTGRCSADLSIDDNELVINKLMAYDNLFYLNVIKTLLNDVNIYIDRHFDPSSRYGTTFMSEQELMDLKFNPELNIPKTLYGIKKNHPDKFELLVNVFKSLFPSIKNLYVDEIAKVENGLRQNLAAYSLFVQDENLVSYVNFLAMSDGARRILLLLTAVVLGQINNLSLICIEEPENSIHPGLLRKFIYSISKLSGNTKILFSSHSPYIINYMRPEDIYIGLPQNNGVAVFKKLKTNTNAKKKLERDILDSNMQLGDYLFDLMSGSEEDLEELRSYVE